MGLRAPTALTPNLRRIFLRCLLKWSRCSFRPIPLAHSACPRGLYDGAQRWGFLRVRTSRRKQASLGLSFYPQTKISKLWRAMTCLKQHHCGITCFMKLRLQGQGIRQPFSKGMPGIAWARWAVELWQKSSSLSFKPIKSHTSEWILRGNRRDAHPRGCGF